MASVGAAIWLPDTETFFVELGTTISRAQQQRNAMTTQFDSSEFFVHRLIMITPEEVASTRLQ